MRAALLALALLAAAPDAAQTAPPFAIEAVFCDCDPRDTVLRTRRAVRAYATPDRTGRAVRTVAAGRLIEGNDWTDALTVVERPDRVVLTRPVRFETVRRFPGTTRPQWDAGRDEGPLALPAGTAVELLGGDQGDGYFRAGGVLYYADGLYMLVRLPEYGETDANARRDGPPGRTSVWFRLRPRAGQPAAWVEVPVSPTDAPALGFEMVCETHSVCPPGVGRR